MKFGLSESRMLRVLGYIILAWGILGIVRDVIAMSGSSGRFELGVGLANCAIVLIGVVATSTAACLASFERRLDQLGRSRSPHDS